MKTHITPLEVFDKKIHLKFFYGALMGQYQ